MNPQGTDPLGAGAAPSTRAVYVISIAAELAGVHPQTLRIYERKGLVSPARTGGGSRRYSDADISLLQRIQSLTDGGLNLAGVKRVIELENAVAVLTAELQEAHRGHRAQLEALEQTQRDALNAAHREHRRDIVPVSTEVTVYRRRR